MSLAYRGASRKPDVRSVIAPLAAMADQRDLAVVGLMHFSKSAGDALRGVGGSIGFVGAARSLMIFGADPNDQRGEEGPARILAHRTCNLGRRQRSRACSVISVVVLPAPAVRMLRVTPSRPLQPAPEST